MDIYEYTKTINILSKYEFGNGYYTEPTNASQLFIVENLQLLLQDKFPDTESAAEALRLAQRTKERVL